jgi:intergrase/recombinase
VGASNFWYLMKTQEISSVMWLLYEWGKSWYGLKKLSKFTGLSMNKINWVLNKMEKEDYVKVFTIFDNGRQLKGFFLSDETRERLRDLDNK